MLKKNEKKGYQKPKMKVHPLKVQAKLMQPTALPDHFGICIDGSDC